MTNAVLAAILELEKVGEDSYRAVTPPGAFASSAIFGGQLIAQALRAAALTTDGRPCNSLQAYFFKAGDPARPVLFQAERVRDGRTFATRRVTALQGDQPFFVLSASFKVPEQGPDRQGTMPDAPDPDDPSLAGWDSPWERAFVTIPFELRRVAPALLPQPVGHPPVQQFWFRAPGSSQEDPALHQAMLAYLSDLGLLSTLMLPDGLPWGEIKSTSTSLDHALWFHRPTDMGQWHLYDQQSPSAADARGLAFGSIWRHDGVLVASVAQEGFYRLV